MNENDNLVRQDTRKHYNYKDKETVLKCMFLLPQFSVSTINLDPKSYIFLLGDRTHCRRFLLS